MIKKVIVGKNLGFIEKAKEVMEGLIEGKEVKKNEDITVFSTIEALNKVLTVERKKMLDVIRSEKIASINQLARRLNRDIKNVHQDLKLLSAYGFVELKKEGRKVVPTVPYTKLKIEIPIGQIDANLDKAVA